MALINCPECGRLISDKASKCPHCGMPAEYFSNAGKGGNSHDIGAINYRGLSNLLISFDGDHTALFSPDHYITQREKQRLYDRKNKLQRRERVLWLHKLF